MASKGVLHGYQLLTALAPIKTQFNDGLTLVNTVCRGAILTQEMEDSRHAVWPRIDSVPKLVIKTRDKGQCPSSV